MISATVSQAGLVPVVRGPAARVEMEHPVRATPAVVALAPLARILVTFPVVVVAAAQVLLVATPLGAETQEQAGPEQSGPLPAVPITQAAAVAAGGTLLAAVLELVALAEVATVLAPPSATTATPILAVAAAVAGLRLVATVARAS